MPIDLQLQRIQKLLRLLNNPHHKPNFIHIAGTNGKGSVCSYISHILTAAGVKNGRFNSPHLITPRDSIQINNEPVALSSFQRCKQLIHDTNEKHAVGCTEFELLTCTAFQIFAEADIPIAIMEVGVGGRLDATNVIPPEKTLLVGITKIALDHQGLLGSNLAEIAYQKVGIFKPNAVAVIDGTNDKSVLDVAQKEAKEVGCELYTTERKDCWVSPALLGEYQYDNLAVALKMISFIKQKYNITDQHIQDGVQKTKWPGRLQKYNLNNSIVGGIGETDILLDGAHNTGAAIELGKYLDTIREESGFVFVIAITKGKELSTLFKPIITKKDTVIFTQFGENIEGMPWIEPFPADELSMQINNQGIKYEEVITKPILKEALNKAVDISTSNGKQIVVCGSLYLVADILRL